MSTPHILGVLDHKKQVAKYMKKSINELVDRAVTHDFSKFSKEEIYLFEESTPKLAKLTYGSKEYKQELKNIEPAIQHHYSVNRHHPEHFENGVYDMNLLDLLEMLCDWIAATKRYKDGNIFKSLEINKERFNITDEMYSILVNTTKFLIEGDINEETTKGN